MRPIDLPNSNMLRFAARSAGATHVASRMEPGALLEEATLAGVSPVPIGTVAVVAEWLPQAHRS